MNTTSLGHSGKIRFADFYTKQNNLLTTTQQISRLPPVPKTARSNDESLHNAKQNGGLKILPRNTNLNSYFWQVPHVCVYTARIPCGLFYSRKLEKKLITKEHKDAKRKKFKQSRRT